MNTKVGHPQAGEKQHRHRQLVFQQVMQQATIPAGEDGDAIVKLLQPPPLLPVAAAQKDRRQHRSQGERVEGGNGNGKRDGQRKLAEQNAGRPGKERNRHEHGNQHQRGGDDGAGNLGCGRRRRFVGIVLARGDMALNVFNHHDGVVDNQAGGQCDAEQRQRIDGEAEQLYKDKCSDQRNRSGDEVNHRRPPVAEKDKDHQDDQQDRRAYREHHVADRFAHRIRRVEGQFVVHSRREFFRKPIQFGDGPPVDIERVCRRKLRHADAHRILPVKLQVAAVIFRAQLGPAHVFQPHQGSVGVGLQDDVVELARLRSDARRPAR